MRTEPWTQVCFDGVAPVVVALARAADVPADRGTLPAADRAACERLGPRRAAEFTRGRVLLRQLIAAVLGRDAASTEITVSPLGAIALAGHPAGISLSHTDGYTAAALWPDGPVGVDVEEPPARLDPRLVRRCCPDWSRRLEQLDEERRTAAFTRVWTVQEACVKATGTGLSGAPWRIPVHPYTVRGRWNDVHWQRPPAPAPVALAVAIRTASSTDPLRLGES